MQQHIYLLDFQKLGGDAFTYMNLCARIITELKTLSGVRLPHQEIMMQGHSHAQQYHQHHTHHAHQHHNQVFIIY